MKFCWSTLMVNNMDESLKFYQEIVGLPLNRRFPAGPGVEIAFLGEGETQIELICNEAIKADNVGQSISWGFEVDTLDEMTTVLKEKGIEIHSGPYQPNPHVKFFYVLDPNGLKIQFVENVKSA
ncbi:MAG: VOC family protein [Eubacteriales bacterium]|nr:VOC family protein [Eubacteriales bacterium]